MPQHITPVQIVFAVCLFGAVTLLGYVILSTVLRADKDPLRDRLGGGKRGSSAPPPGTLARNSQFSPVVERVTKVIAQPLMSKDREEVSRLRRRFAHAGIYSGVAMQL